MSTIKAENIAKGANSTDMDNAIFGSAKALVVFENTAGTVHESFNTSSVVDTGTATWTINLTTAMTNTNYYPRGGVRATTNTDREVEIKDTSTASAIDIRIYNTATAGSIETNYDRVYMAVFGNQ